MHKIKHAICILLSLVTLSILGCKKQSSSENINLNSSAKQEIQNQSQYKEVDLIGTWTRSIADPNDPDCKKSSKDEICFPNDSEEIEFSIADGKKMYSSWIHSKPENSQCTWNLNNSSIVVQCSSSNASYKINSLTKKQLTLDSNIYKKYTKK
jgi:hypothetical protein